MSLHLKSGRPGLKPLLCPVQVLRKSGSAKEKEWAKRIEPVSLCPIKPCLQVVIIRAALRDTALMCEKAEVHAGYTAQQSLKHTAQLLQVLRRPHFLLVTLSAVQCCCNRGTAPYGLASIQIPILMGIWAPKLAAC